MSHRHRWVSTTSVHIHNAENKRLRCTFCLDCDSILRVYWETPEPCYCFCPDCGKCRMEPDDCDCVIKGKICLKENWRRIRAAHEEYVKFFKLMDAQHGVIAILEQNNFFRNN